MLPVYIMYAALLATVVSAVIVEGEIEVEESECEINADPTKEVRPSECCLVGDILPIEFKEMFKSCEEIHPLIPQDTYGQDPWTMWVHHTSCLDECIWDKLRLLNKAKKINTAAVRARFTKGIKEQTVLTAVNYALDNCFVIYKDELEANPVTAGLECHSGPTELLACYMREVFLNCPDDRWTENPPRMKEECNTLWDKVDGCPRIHVMLHSPSRQQKASRDENANWSF